MYVTDIMFLIILLLSDGNVTAIITGIFGVIILILTVVVLPLLNKIISNQKSDRITIRITMNNMKDELESAKKDLEEAVRYTKEILENRQIGKQKKT